VKRWVWLGLILLLVGCGSAAAPTPNLVAALTVRAGAAAAAGFQRYTADDVIKAFQDSDLAVADVTVDRRDPGALAPSGAIESKEFIVLSIAPKGGRVLIFREPQDLAAVQARFDRVPDLAPYVYTKGNALVQLNGGLPQAEAEKYKAALERMQ
jgi:hypothetical protein